MFKIGESVEHASGATPDEYNLHDVSISEDGNTLTVIKVIADGGVFWRFKMAKEGSSGAELPQTDTDGDGIIDA